MQHSDQPLRNSAIEANMEVCSYQRENTNKSHGREVTITFIITPPPVAQAWGGGDSECSISRAESRWAVRSPSQNAIICILHNCESSRWVGDLQITPRALITHTKTGPQQVWSDNALLFFSSCVWYCLYKFLLFYFLAAARTADTQRSRTFSFLNNNSSDTRAALVPRLLSFMIPSHEEETAAEVLALTNSLVHRRKMIIGDRDIHLPVVRWKKKNLFRQ